jgi:hypothetical protein
MLREIHELAAERRRMAEVFAALMFLLGGWQVFSAWRG